LLNCKRTLANCICTNSNYMGAEPKIIPRKPEKCPRS
jgi:hypothetical protein